MVGEDDMEMDSNKVYNKLEEMDNKLERIKSDTHNLNRLASLSNAPLIVQELKRAIGRSEVRAEILHLTKNLINATDLSTRLNIDPRNLAAYIEPFMGNKGFITLEKKGRERYYQRSELVDLVGFESIPEFSELIRAFESKRQQAASVNANVTTGDANVS